MTPGNFLSSIQNIRQTIHIRCVRLPIHKIGFPDVAFIRLYLFQPAESRLLFFFIRNQKPGPLDPDLYYLH